MGGVTCNRTRDFLRFFNQYYFNCYTYTGLRPSGTTDSEELQWLPPGLDSGLTMVVLAGSGMLKPNEYANLIPGIYDLGSAIAGADGVRVIIHPPDVVPFPLAEGFDVPPGFSTSFGVRPRRNVRIGPPHGDCVSNNPFDTESHVRRPYRQLVCQKQCIQSYVKAECGCLDEMLLRPPSDYEENYDGTTMMCHSTELFPKTCATDPSPDCFKALLDQYDRVQCAKVRRPTGP
jgi:Amiloride-sensitive sodium channel